MNAYYSRTFSGMAVLLVAAGAVAVLANSMAERARTSYGHVLEAAKTTAQRCATQRQNADRLREAIAPVREFTSAWRQFARLPEKEAAERMRASIETLAQRHLGLVTDSAITPQPENFSFQGTACRVQRVTLRASGKDLTALVTWLGKVEESYPGACVEWCELSSNVGGNTALTLRLVQPLQEPGPKRLTVTLAPDMTLLPDAIASVPWARYLPARVKAAVPVGFPWNPLQPAVSADARVSGAMHAGRDEIAPRIAQALEGRVRSVVRGAAPIVVVDGRIFRIGDELTLGSAREKLLSDVRARLKMVREDRLVLQVSGGTAERPVQCDVAYMLPSFLHAR